jgi:uncharacterized protein with PQ loop repeat
MCEPLMAGTGIVQPLATLPQNSILYSTHSQDASGQSLATGSIYALATLSWVAYGLLNRKAAICKGNIIGVTMKVLIVIGILIYAGFGY